VFEMRGGFAAVELSVDIWYNATGKECATWAQSDLWG